MHFCTWFFPTLISEQLPFISYFFTLRGFSVAKAIGFVYPIVDHKIVNSNATAAMCGYYWYLSPFVVLD